MKPTDATKGLRHQGRDIRAMAKRFRLLRGHKISVRPPTRQNAGRSWHSGKRPHHVIWIYDGEPVPVDFPLHEVLHCCNWALSHQYRRATKEWLNAEEGFVRDLCRIVYPKRKESGEDETD